MPKRPTKPQSPESLAEIARVFADSSALIAGVAAALEKESAIKTLHVTNHDQLRRAMEYVENFASAARVALRKAKDKVGDFEATEGRRKNRTPSDTNAAQVHNEPSQNSTDPDTGRPPKTRGKGPPR